MRPSPRASTAAETLVVLLRSHLRRGGVETAAAAAYAERLLTLVREPEGPAGALLAKALMLTGQVAERGGDYAGAREAFTEALAVHEAAGLPADADQVGYLLALANVRTRLGDYAGVGAMYERALAVAAEREGPRGELAAKVLANHAIYAKRTGDISAARDLYGQTLAIQVELYGEDNLSVARTHYNLGNLLIEMTEYDGARTHYLRSLAIRESLLGPESPEVARVLAALALLEQNAADLLRARAYAERAVAIQRSALPPLHPQRAEGLSVLAVIQADLGDFEAARATLEEVLAVYEKAYGPTHIRVGGVVVELGRINERAGDAAGALAAYDRARSIFAADEGGRDQLAGILQVEARLRAELGPDPEAVALARRSLDLRSETPGPGNRALARPLATLGFCLWRAGEFARADSCLGQALQFLASAGAEGHPYHLLAQLDLARVRLALGDREGALDLALAVEQGRRAALRVILRGLPERLALEHVGLWPRGVEYAASLVVDGGSAADVARTWDEVILSRALVLDEMALRYRAAALSADAATDSLRRALAGVTRDEAGLLVAGWQGEDGDDLRERFATLRSRHEELERRLGDRDPSSSGAVPTLATVAAALPADMALVGYLRREARFDAEAGYL
ncbi:MAG: tetratricopeptide repeat protein, partial [Krumholzibacteria bacterium]|nr:tetratricopeptide repeat protein [Candidatus Krumholzibacteria bacterium]